MVFVTVVFMLVVIVLGMRLMVMAVLMSMIVVVLKRNTLTEFQHMGLRQIHHRDDPRFPGQRLNRIVHPGCQVRPHLEHDIRALQRCRLGRAHRISMGRRTGPQDQIRLTCPLHHAGHQAMQRRDINGHRWRLRPGRNPAQQNTQHS